MKKYTQRKLAGYAQAVLRKYQPLVIGITGSVGKTSAKEAVFAALRSHPGVATNAKNFNNEFGVPLAVLQVQSSPGRSLGAWAKVFLKARSLVRQHLPYPKVLILEMGIDHPGDMDYLADLVRPQIAVITAIGKAHIEYFGSEERIAEEKVKILKHLGITGTAVLNYDDARLHALLPKLSCNVISYGMHAAADIRAHSIEVVEQGKALSGTWGTQCSIEYGTEHTELFLPGLVGTAHVLACLAGIGVALAMKIPFTEAVANVRHYKPQPGRMHLLPGVWNSLIIDDSYNSSPQAALLAIAELQKFPAKNKIAVLGDMRELGAAAPQAHRDLAQPLLKSGVQHILLVGPETKALANELATIGYPKTQVLHFNNAYEAAHSITKLAAPDTVFLVKGSQNTIRLERVVKALLRYPEQASKVLVRQDPSWLQKK